MKPFFIGTAATVVAIAATIVVVTIATLFAPLAHAADASCRPFRIPAEIDLPAGELVLADLFPSSTCAAILSRARRVPLGSVPLAGSPRVLAREELRFAFEKLGGQERLAAELIDLPERVTVHRRGEQEVIAAVFSRQAERSRATHSVPASAAPVPERVVRPGQTVTLIWDQDGIRVQVRALCLDMGANGSQVRARILQSGMVVRATVVGAGSLRVTS